MANIRWTNNDPLTTFDNFSIPVTDMNEGMGVDKQIGKEQLKQLIINNTLGDTSISKVTSFRNKEFLKPSSWNISDISMADDIPDNLKGNDIGKARLVVYGGNNGGAKYVVQCLTYVDVTSSTIRTIYRALLFNGQEQVQSSTEWQSSVSDADIAHSLAKGSTINGDEVAGKNWTLGKLKEKGYTAIVGRNLVDVLNAVSARDAFDKIRAMGTDYSKLQLGDYIDIPSITVGGSVLQNTSGNLRVEIQGFDHYYRVGDTESPRGVLFGFRNCPLTRRYNADNNNSGGYNGSELKGYVNGDFSTGLENAIGSIKTVHRLVDTHGSWAWSAERCFLPSEVEVFGYQAWGRGGYYSGTSVQFPIYSLDPSRRVKTYNGSRQWWWEGTSDSGSTTYFCYCYISGNAGNYYASDVNGVSPAFLI